MPHKALVARGSNGLHDRWVVDLLSIVEFLSTRNSSRVVMSNVVLELIDSYDLVTVHDLLVVDVVKDFHAIRTDRVANIDCPFNMVALIARVSFHVFIDASIQRFEAEIDPFLFRNSDYGFQTCDRIGFALIRVDVFEHAREGDDVFCAEVRRRIDGFDDLFPAIIPVLSVVPATGKTMAAGDGTLEA